MKVLSIAKRRPFTLTLLPLLVIATLLFRPVAALGSLRETEFDPAWSQPTISPYLEPQFASELRALQPAIRLAALRHNDPALSGMGDQSFATIVTAILASEHVGWLDSRVALFRPLMAPFQAAQTSLNLSGQTDLTIWPSNLRPSVAAEILRGDLPLPGGAILVLPLRVEGSQAHDLLLTDQVRAYAVISAELNDPQLAVEYLAANLERGVIRARIEGAPVDWRTLATWHNQGVVSARDIRAHPSAVAYLGRTAAYLNIAAALVESGPEKAFTDLVPNCAASPVRVC